MSEFKFVSNKDLKSKEDISKRLKEGMPHNHVQELWLAETAYQLKRIADILDESILTKLEPYDGMLVVSVAKN